MANKNPKSHKFLAKLTSKVVTSDTEVSKVLLQNVRQGSNKNFEDVYVHITKKLEPLLSGITYTGSDLNIEFTAQVYKYKDSSNKTKKGLKHLRNLQVIERE